MSLTNNVTTQLTLFLSFGKCFLFQISFVKMIHDSFFPYLQINSNNIIHLIPFLLLHKRKKHVFLSYISFSVFSIVNDTISLWRIVIQFSFFFTIQRTPNYKLKWLKLSVSLYSFVWMCVCAFFDMHMNEFLHIKYKFNFPTHERRRKKDFSSKYTHCKVKDSTDIGPVKCCFAKERQTIRLIFANFQHKLIRKFLNLTYLCSFFA